MKFLEESILKGGTCYTRTCPHTHYFLPPVAACALPRPALAFFMRSFTSLHAQGALATHSKFRDVLADGVFFL